MPDVMTRDLLCVPLDMIDAGEDYNSRKYSAADIKLLADEMLATGRQLQPVGLALNGDGLYRLVYGFRRYKALKMLQTKVEDSHPLKQIEGVLLDVDAQDHKTLFEYNVRENTNRMDLSPVDQAYALDRLVNEFNETLTAAARIMGKSKAWASQTIALLKLPPHIQKRVHEGQLGAQTAYELSRLDSEQLEAAIQEMDAAGVNTQEAARTAMRNQQEEAEAQADDPAPDKSSLIKARTIKEFRAFLGTEMGRVESSMPEDESNPAEYSPRYKLMSAILYWLDGRGGRGADKKLRKAFAEAVPEVGDDA